MQSKLSCREGGVEPDNNNNTAAATQVAANPTHAPAPTFNHPPYAEMIHIAIAALNERDRSSRRAIAKYIEHVYSSLPPTHSALLTRHLKRLKNSGHLEMVKKSYKIPGPPRSDPPPPPATDSPAPTSVASPGQPRGWHCDSDTDSRETVDMGLSQCMSTTGEEEEKKGKL
ncbi:HMG-Y-related protein A [Rosa chinensis]|uniref:HMG-Y-related protein A n=1 Tax=Rosa chinensis TaxID=74649 RepID=UPI000D0940AA|nr:HMG-Y-related protein A [Rosa chinensis]